MTEEHVPIEELAAYAAGDLDAAGAVAVEAHVLLCADCRADVEALNATAAALASVPRVTMPADVAARLDDAVTQDRRAPLGDIVPLHARRRPSLSALGAVAAALLLVGAITIPQLTKPSRKSTTAASAPEAARHTNATTLRRSTGFAYTHDALAQTLGAAIGVAQQMSADHGVAASPTAPSPAPAGAPREGAMTYSTATKSLQTDPARLAACIATLRDGEVPEARVPLFIDYGTFAGKPAMVIVFNTIRDGAVRADRVDVFVTGPGCGAVEGGDVLDFQRIPRPSGL